MSQFTQLSFPTIPILCFAVISCFNNDIVTEDDFTASNRAIVKIKRITLFTTFPVAISTKFLPYFPAYRRRAESGIEER